MYLLDTDALSLTNDVKGLHNREIERWQNWVVKNRTAIYLSVVTLMEVRFGIEKLNAKGATQRAVSLRRWLLAAETTHKGRIIAVTPEIAHRAGKLLFNATSTGHNPGSEDALIAATSDIHGFVLVSRNGKDMQSLGVNWINPLAVDPEQA